MEFAFALIHGDNNPGLKTNWNVVYFTSICQILAIIIMHNIVPQTSEFRIFSHILDMEWTFEVFK